MKPVIKYKKVDYKYELEESFEVLTRIDGYEAIAEFINLDMDGFLTLRKGYKWDGASGPAIDTESFMRSSAIHDALYRLMELRKLPPTLRKAADKELKHWCKVDGMSFMRRQWVYRAVRWFGG